MLHRLWYHIALMLIDGNTLLIDTEIRRYDILIEKMNDFFLKMIEGIDSMLRLLEFPLCIYVKWTRI